MAQVRFRTKTGQVVSFAGAEGKKKRRKGNRKPLPPVDKNKCRWVKSGKSGCFIKACERRGSKMLAFQKGTKVCGRRPEGK